MTLGEKLLKARQEAGMSQRQLCGDTITRNMLSQIEHGTARPSMDTLQILAARLGKSVGYFLDEDTITSPNQRLMEHARRACDAGDFSEARLVLEGFQTPDPVFQREYRFLAAGCAMAAGKQALAEGKDIYAGQLFREAIALADDLTGTRRQCLLLLGQLPGADLAEICAQLPSLDDELLLRAEAALGRKDPLRALELLSAMEHATPRSHLIKGLALLEQKEFQKATRALLLAQAEYPEKAHPALEICYRELGDFREAYRWAAAQLNRRQTEKGTS